MVNQELIQYIKQQLSLGEAKERIGEILLGAGWADQDIKEAMSVAASPAITAKPAMPTTQPANAPAVQPAGISLKVQETVRSREPATPLAGLSTPGGPMSFSVKPSVMMSGGGAAAMRPSPVFDSIQKINPTSSVSEKPKEAAKPIAEPKVSMVAAPRMSKIPLIVVSVIALLALGGAVKLFLGTNDLNAKIEQLTQENGVLTSQITELSTKGGDAASRVVALLAENADIASQLSLFVVPVSTSTQPKQEIPFAVRGKVSGGEKVAYTLTTSKGVILNIKNGKDLKIDPVLQTFIGKDVEISGTHLPGSVDVMIKTLNGNQL